MSARTNGHVVTNGSHQVSQTDAVHAALRTVVRNLLGVDDSMMDLPLRQFKVCLKLYRQSRSMSEVGLDLKLCPSLVTHVSARLALLDVIHRVVEWQLR